MPSGKPCRWEFEKRGQSLAVDVPGPLMLNHPQLMVESALAGLGIAYVPDRVVQAHLQAGRLIALLGDWCPPFLDCFSTTLATAMFRRAQSLHRGGARGLVKGRLEDERSRV